VIIIAALLASVAAPDNSAAINAAPEDALRFDRLAYMGTCGEGSRERQLASLQQRAVKLNDRYVKEFLEPGVILLRYIDRRPQDRCKLQSEFDVNIENWKRALDKIDAALGG
jgi:hypothetical protein